MLVFALLKKINCFIPKTIALQESSVNQWTRRSKIIASKHKTHTLASRPHIFAISIYWWLTFLRPAKSSSSFIFFASCDWRIVYLFPDIFHNSNIQNKYGKKMRAKTIYFYVFCPVSTFLKKKWIHLKFHIIQYDIFSGEAMINDKIY